MTPRDELALELRDRQSPAIDYTEWFDLPDQAIVPQCGQCQHFRLTALNGAEGCCRQKVEPYHPTYFNRTVYQSRNAADEGCDQFAADCPF